MLPGIYIVSIRVIKKYQDWSFKISLKGDECRAEQFI